MKRKIWFRTEAICPNCGRTDAVHIPTDEAESPEGKLYFVGQGYYRCLFCKDQFKANVELLFTKTEGMTLTKGAV